MAMHLEWVEYGRPAAGALRSAIAAAKGDDPLEPVTVVVPSNHVGVATRRLLASGVLGPCCGRGAGVASVGFVTPYRLAELLGASRLAATGRRPVSTPVIAAGLRAALADRPGVFAPVAQHPATEMALVAAYRELRDLSEMALDAVAANGSRAADVVRLHRSVRSRLEPAWYDEQDLTLAASEELRSGEGVRPGLGAIVIYLPQRLSRHSAMLLAASGEDAEVTVLAAGTGDAGADAEVVTSLHRLGVSTTGPPDFGRPVVAADRTRIVTTSDADDEVRYAVRAVLDAARSGAPLDRIAILHAGPEPYARLIHDQLAAAGIAANGAAIMPLTARMASRSLLQLLELPETNFRRQDFFAWLGAGPTLHHGHLAPVSAWERLARDAAVVAGREQWDHLLAELADHLDSDAEAAAQDIDQPAWKAERWHDEAARARDLRIFVLDLIGDLAEAAAAPRPWGEHARWAADLLERIVGDGRRRDRWPVVERKSAERVERAIARLHALDAVEGAVGLDVFTRTLELELESDLGRVGRFGEGVLVGQVGMGVGLDLDLVVVVGLAEGSFPALVGDDSLLPDAERQAAGGELPLRRQLIERQHRELLAALGGARSQLLCLPRGDLRRSSDHVPSRWLLDLASALAGPRWWSEDLLEGQAPWLHHVASFDAGVRGATFPATDQEHRLRSLLASTPGRSALSASADAVLAAGATVIASRRSDRFTRFDGHLAGLATPSPVTRAVSPTSLELFARCPMAYLMKHILGVQTIDNPEDELHITPIDRGQLMHSAFERFIVEVLARPPGSQPGPDEAWSNHDRDRMAVIGAELCDEYEHRGRTGRPIFWRRQRSAILFDLQRFLDLDSAHRRQHRSRPVAAELAFGIRGSGVAAVSLDLPDGRRVLFRGKADRVDVSDDGTLHIVDYKTGSTRGFTGMSEDDPDLHGHKLQLAVYGAAARLYGGCPDTKVRAEYWFTSSKGKFERIGYAVSPEVLARVAGTLGTMVDCIEAGVFPSHPSATTTSWVDCEYCDPDGLGVAELGRQWERKRGDPALSPYADLVEPPEVVGV